MITSNAMYRVFQVKFGGATGTAFTIDHAEEEFLVTAAHVVEGLAGSDKLEIWHSGDWRRLPVQLVGRSALSSDVAVLKAGQRLTPAGLPLPATGEGIVYGQDVFFLGFPYGMVGSWRFEHGYPLPWAKKATLSLFDGHTLYLDGHNNPGFSGGPVVFVPPGGPANAMKVAGVISGYRAAREQVRRGEQEDGDLSVDTNTGIIVSYGIALATTLIEEWLAEGGATAPLPGPG